MRSPDPDKPERKWVYRKEHKSTYRKRIKPFLLLIFIVRRELFFLPLMGKQSTLTCAGEYVRY